jgi:hypothetical protein
VPVCDSTRKREREKGRGIKIALMEERFFAFSLIIEGTTEKVLQFMMTFKSIYNRNFGFTEQKMYF